MSRFDRLLWFKTPAIRSYGIAFLSVAAAMFVLGWPSLHLQQAPASVFLCAILFSAWFGGTRPGLLATVLSILAYYYFLPPIGLLNPKPTELIRLFVFVATTGFVWSLCSAQRSAAESLRRARDDLRVRFQEVQQANVALRAESRERMQTENRLRRSEAYLAEAQKLSHTGSFGWKPSTGEIFWSEESFQIFQYDRAIQPTLELILQRVHPEDAPSFEVTVEQALRDGKDFEHEYRLVMLDGSLKYVHVVAHADRDESDEIEFVGAVMDVTERKLAAEDLLRTETYLAEGQKLSHTATWACSIATREMIHSSAEHRRLFGLVPEGVETPPFDEFYQRIHPDDRGPIIEDLERAIAAGTDVEAHFRVVLPDGTTRYMYGIGRPLVKPSGEISEFVGAVMDVTERKQAEEALRRSEGYLAEAQRLSHTGSWAWNPASRRSVYWSQENYRLFGFDQDGDIPSDEVFYQRVHPEDRDRVRRDVFLESPNEGSHFDVDFRIVLPGGAIKYVRSTGHRVRNISGDLVEYIGTSIDVTELKRAEDRTRLIIDTVPAQLWTETREGVVDFVNRRWIDYTGMTLAQAVGAGWNRMVHPDDLERVLGKWRTLILEGKPREIEARLRRSDGTYRWFLCRCYPLVDGSGQILGWYGSDTDIHDRKEAEEKLRKSEAHLQEAQTLGRMGSWVFDISAGTVSGSPELFRIFGLDPGKEQQTKEMLRKVRSISLFRASVHPEDLPFVEEVTTKTVSEARAGEIECRIVLPDGAVKLVHGVAHPVFDSSGKLIEYIGTIMDVTERKRADESLRQAQAELAHVSRVTTMGELTASLAHEVNQPIAASVTNAKTCLRWLAGEPPNLEEARAAVTRIVKDQTRAAEIISRTRRLFTKGALQWEWVDVNEVVEEMIVLLRGEAMRYNISFWTELEAGLPEVKGDRVHLQQVLMNLIMNSIDAMKDVEGARELAIKSERGEDEELLVSVRDTGVGLPGQQAEQIFTAFFTTKSHGTGMGLRICRSIVEAHGGRIWAGHNSPCGASFYFTLPVKVEPAE
jgi:PAS domain S-box-containing protein